MNNTNKLAKHNILEPYRERVPMSLKKILLPLALLWLSTSLHAQTGPAGIGSTDGTGSLRLWLDAAVGTNTTTNGAAITSWADQSGHGHDLAANGGSDPVYLTDVINGSLPAVHFTGDDMAGPDLGFGASGTSDYGVFMVLRDRGSSAFFTPIFTFSSRGIVLRTPVEDQRYVLSAVADGGGRTSSITASDWNIATMVSNNLNNAVGYGNGVQGITATGNAAVGASAITLGLTSAINSQIAEVIVYANEVSTAERIIIENYLAAKYGLPLGANDLYTMDNAANGDYDFDVAGIGVAADGSNFLESRGASIVTIATNTTPQNGRFLFWGNNGQEPLFAGLNVDVPPSIASKLATTWRVSETTGDLGNLTVTFDLSALNLTQSANNVRLLVDADGSFATTDNSFVGIFDADNNTLTFTSINLSDADYFTLGQIPTQLPVVTNPVLNMSVDEDSDQDTVILTDIFTDPNGDPLTFTTSVLGDDLLTGTLTNDTLLLLNYLPNRNGFDTVIVFATDISSGITADTFIVTVNSVNDAPQLITPIADVSANTGSSFTLSLSTNFADPEGDTFTYTANLSDGSALPSWLSFDDAVPSFSGIPSIMDLGMLDIVLLASNGALSSSDTFTLTVIDAIVTGPGGVGSADGSSSLELWFDANAGITGSMPVTGVTDQSGNGVALTVGGDPSLNATSVNGVDAITFDGTGDFLATNLRINAGSVPRVTLLSVYRPRVNGARAVWGEDNGDFDRFLQDHPTFAAGNNSVSSGTGFEGNITDLFVTGSYSLSTVVHQEDVADGSEVYVNGTSQRTFTSNHAPETSNPFVIALNGNSFAFDGDIAEVLVYSDTLSTVQRIIVENYLSAKYGLPLAANDLYTMDNAANGNYDFEVAGIGVAADGSTLLISRGTGIVTISVRTVPSDSTFLFWGNNEVEELFIEVSDVPTGIGGRLNTVWRVSESGGDVGIVDMTFDLSNLNLTVAGGSVRLLLDNDGDFSTTDNIATGTFHAGNNTITFANINLADGQYFTLGQTPTTAPVVANALLDISVDEDAAPDTINLADVFTDPDGAALIFTANALSDDLITVAILQDTSLLINYLADSSGIDTVVVFATEGSSPSVRDTLIVTVNTLFDSVELATPIADVSADAAALFSLDLSENIILGDNAVTYTLNLNDGSALPAWLNFDDAVPSFSGIPTSVDAGILNVVVAADDGTRVVRDTFILEVVPNFITGPGGVGSTDGMSDLTLWLDAAVGTNTTTDGAAITSWADQSGHGHDLAANGGSDPVYLTNLIDGSLPAVHFTSDDMAGPDLGFGASGTSDYGVFMVLRDRGSTAFFTSIFRFSTLTLNLRTPAGGQRYALNVPGGAGGRTPIITASDWNIASMVSNNRNNAIGYGNGVQGTTASGNAAVGASAITLGLTSAINSQIAEVIVYAGEVNIAERIIIENYLAAKYGLPLGANDLYTMDNAANGDYDFDVAGVGVADDGSSSLESRGASIVTVATRTLPQSGRFLFWGNNGEEEIFIEVADVPAGIGGRLATVWRVSESGGDVGIVDMTFDLSNLNLTVAGGNVRLLLDNDGDFSTTDNIATGTFDAGNNTITFADIDLTDGQYFSLGQTPTTAPVVANALLDISVDEDAAPDTINLANVFADPDGAALIFTANALSDDLITVAILQDTSLLINYLADSSGIDTVVVFATEGSSPGVRDTLIITVNALFDSVELATPIADVSADAAALFSLDLSENIILGDNAVTYTLNLNDGSALPAWLNFDDAVPSFSGIPTSVDAGILNVVVAADDGTRVVRDTFILEVTPNFITGPGGIGSTDGNSDLALWLDANAGITGSAPITGVTDQSGNGVTLTVGGDPSLNVTSVNGVDAITFDGTGDFLATNLSINAGSVPRVTLLSVYRPRVNGAGAVWGEDNGGFDRFLQDHPTFAAGNNSVSSGTGFEGNITDLFVAGNYSLSTVVHQEDVTGGSEVYVSGGLARTFTSNHAPEVSSPLQIAAIGAGGLAFDGDIAEVLVYGDTLSTVQRIIAENYLSAKYGLSLAANDLYTMDNAANGNYDFDVAGIGVAADGSSTLESRGASIVTVATRTLPQSGRFLFWGNNGEEEIFIEVADVPAGIGGRLATVWRVSESGGDVGIVDMTFDLSNLNLTVAGGNVRLLLDNDGDFSTTDNIATGTFHAGNNTITFANINLADGQYFTLGQTPTTAPVVANALLDISVDEDAAPDTINLADVFTDPDGAALIFTANALSDDLITVAILQDTSLLINYLADSSGIDTVVVFATEGSSPGVRDTLIITVNALFDSVELATPIADVSADAAALFSLDLSENIILGDNAVTYTLNLNDGSALPAWLNFDDAVPSFSGIPISADAGILNVVVAADDGTRVVRDTFILEVVPNFITGPGGVGSTDGMSDLTLWLDAAVGTNTTTDGAAITSWADQSGHGHDLAANGGSDPVYLTNLIDGSLPAVHFTSDDMAGPDLGFGASGTSDYGVFMVLRDRGSTAFFTSIFRFSTLTLNLRTPAGGQRYALNVPGGAGGRTPIITASDWNIASMVSNNRNNAIGYGNGVQGTTASGNAAVGASAITLGLTSAINSQIAEVIVYAGEVNTAERIIIENYLAAKYGLPLGANDLYTMDNAANGDYDFDVAGIGLAADGSGLIESRGTGTVTVATRTVPQSGRFLFWGNNGEEEIFIEVADVPMGIGGRLNTVWRVSESGGDVGIVDMTFDLSNLNLTVAGGNVRLLLDNDGDFSTTDNIATGTFDAGNNTITFADIDLTDGQYFSLGQTPTTAPVVANALSDISVDEDAAPNTINIANVFADPDGAALFLRANALDDDLITVSLLQDSLLVLNYLADSSGIDTVVVFATEGSSPGVRDTLIVTVNEVNDPPELVSPLADVSATAGSLVFLDLSDNFIDPDGDTITYTANLADGSALPDWLNFADDIPSFLLSPFSSDIASLDVLVAADDGTTTVRDTFALEVTARGHNTGPGGVGCY